MNSWPAFAADSTIPLIKRQYFDFLVAAIDDARHRVWVSMFIADVTVFGDPLLLARRIVRGLEYAKWRNVDTRVLLGLSEMSDLWVRNAATLLYLREQGIAAKLFRSERRRTSHSKYIIVDSDLTIVGSHNWTPNSLSGAHNEISLALYGADLATALQQEFLQNWETSKDNDD